MKLIAQLLVAAFISLSMVGTASANYSKLSNESCIKTKSWLFWSYDVEDKACRKYQRQQRTKEPKATNKKGIKQYLSSNGFRFHQYGRDKKCMKASKWWGWSFKKVNKACRNHDGGGKPDTKKVPELDAASASISVALVTGLLALGLERRRRKSARRSPK
ncbi:hypothetical protein [Marinibactrum halimedae]|uniref:VPDSG-CTERM protein sorting domain-containing protein n=1 Tax=Marinibactrum halimedae TaxID=1444977 RepID=A0AA37T4L1_9GAMM|nr:hypothetical protein [Marinibactrum halimedae]MCD9457403.1 hypothetical protein [Marinibactrum halimedae]GLS25546.1 hypothetical protein GCM10007877_12600 [Marinibactrum halimedae]